MKNKKFWSWTIGLSLLALLTCGGFIALGLWAVNRLGSGGNLNLAFGEGVAIIRVEVTDNPYFNATILIGSVNF